jgi:exo-beta-1,3-glucanase (GH17 family)
MARSPRSAGESRSALVAMLALGVAAASLAGCASEKSTEVMVVATPDTTVAFVPNNPIYGLCFSAYVYPGQQGGSVIPLGQITALLSNLRGYTQWIRTFGFDRGLEAVAPLARQMGFKTAMGAWSGTEYPKLIAAAKAGNVDLAIAGGEMVLNGASEDYVLSNIQNLKSQLPAGVPVSYADTWGVLLSHPRLMDAVDVVMVNIYPFADGVSINQALPALQSAYAAVVGAANGKPVILAETGWPSVGPLWGAALPSWANTAAYFSAVEAWARGANVPLFYFQAYDEPGMLNENGHGNWGIMSVGGVLKPGVAAVFQK